MWRDIQALKRIALAAPASALLLMAGCGIWEDQAGTSTEIAAEVYQPQTIFADVPDTASPAVERPSKLPLLPEDTALNSGSKDSDSLQGIEALPGTELQVLAQEEGEAPTPFSTIAVRVVPGESGVAGLFVRMPGSDQLRPGQQYILRLIYLGAEKHELLAAIVPAAEAASGARQAVRLGPSSASIPRAVPNTPWKMLEALVTVPEQVKGEMALKLYSPTAREAFAVDMMSLRRKTG